MKNKWVRACKGLRTVPGPRKPFIIAIFQYYSASLPLPRKSFPPVLPVEDAVPFKTHVFQETLLGTQAFSLSPFFFIINFLFFNLFFLILFYF